MKHTNEHCAMVIKYLHGLDNLIKQNEFNCGVFNEVYPHWQEFSNDIEYSEIAHLLNNFILSAAIIKQFVGNITKIIDEELSLSSEYTNTVDSLMKKQQYMILLGLRNYLQHVFDIQLGVSGVLSDEQDESHLAIVNFQLYNYKGLRDNPENAALISYFKDNFEIPIQPFVNTITKLLMEFRTDYNNVINLYYKEDFTEYNNTPNDQYAEDMHNVYYENLMSFIEKDTK